MVLNRHQAIWRCPGVYQERSWSFQEPPRSAQGRPERQKDKMELKATEMMNEDQLEAAKIENDIADRQAKFDLEAIKQENENRRNKRQEATK